MKNLKKVFLEWGIPIIVAMCVAILVNKFLVFNIEVPSGSMLPTIGIGERFIATRIYNFENIKRGDILIFDSNQEEKLYIKRLIGLPGDKIDIEDGEVFINGEKLQEDYVKYPMETTDSYEVPKDSYFFLGDNRAGSSDAREWDDPYIKQESIKGKAQIRIYPFNKIGSIQ